jgi:bleomycin hydrolase
MKRLLYIFCVLLTVGCTQRPPKHFTHEVLNPMTPIKNQGKSQLCWAYAMLAAIETEHLRWGDSVNLSAAYIEKMMQQEELAPESKRGMGATLLTLIQKYGIVGYDAMRSADVPEPRYVFMLGAEYTPQEFARSVCAPDEYILLTSTADEPYYKEVELQEPDNWLNNRFLNIPMDSLLTKTIYAVQRHHGVCWESRSHAMAIVGLAHDDEGHRFFVMKNSWGTNRPYHGLEYLSFKEFKRQTLAVEMTHEAYSLRPSR